MYITEKAFSHLVSYKCVRTDWELATILNCARMMMMIIIDYIDGQNPHSRNAAQCGATRRNMGQVVEQQRISLAAVLLQKDDMSAYLSVQSANRYPSQVVFINN